MMPCKPLKMENGGTALVCTRSKRARKCKFCGSPAGLLCDHIVQPKRTSTCDSPLCESCAVHEGDKDYCPHHPPRPQLALVV